jgi:restriction system protein
MQRRKRGRLPSGERTPQEAYYLPILQTLIELGGRGQTGEVLDRVGRLMKGVLRPVDLQPNASTPGRPRWKKAAEFARLKMVKLGLLRDDSPEGTWEITEAGRREAARRSAVK